PNLPFGCLNCLILAHIHCVSQGFDSVDGF
ncbi:MAG: hypothetical protein ACJAXT_000433, partial [Paracoccaceae bacterium]